MKLASCLELFCCGECVQNGTSVSGTVVFTLATVFLVVTDPPQR